MDSIQRLMDLVRTDTVEVDAYLMVFMTHINNPHSFYVRPFEYDMYMSAVIARGDRMTESDITLGTIAIFKSEIQKDYIRGKIVFIKSTHQTICHLFAIDDGFVEKNVPLQNIWKPYHQVNLPPLAIHCQLANCVPRGCEWENSTIESVRDFLKGKLISITVKNTFPNVVLVDVTNCPNDMALLLAMASQSYYSYEDKTEQQEAEIMDQAISDQFYLARALKVKDLILVRMQAGSIHDKFFVAPVDEYNSFLQHRDNYTDYAYTANSIDPELLKLNAAVGVFDNDTHKYERGIIKDLFLNENKVKVELVDWGKVVEESIEGIKPIPHQFMQHLPIAIFCSLHVEQYSLMSQSDVANLSKISYTGLEFMISIEELGVDECPHMVTVYDIKE